jgi:hypothetical protein
MIIIIAFNIRLFLHSLIKASLKGLSDIGIVFFSKFGNIIINKFGIFPVDGECTSDGNGVETGVVVGVTEGEWSLFESPLSFSIKINHK